jgi:hypothetical protein
MAMDTILVFQSEPKLKISTGPFNEFPYTITIQSAQWFLRKVVFKILANQIAKTYLNIAYISF